MFAGPPGTAGSASRPATAILRPTPSSWQRGAFPSRSSVRQTSGIASRSGSGSGSTNPGPGWSPSRSPAKTSSFASGLSGVSIDATVSCGTTSFRENILFTHRGLSGPAVLQASSYWFPGGLLTIDLSPDADLREILTGRRAERAELTTVLSEILPKRFVSAWCARFAPSRPIARFSNDELGRIAAGLHSWSVVPAGTEGFSKAEVTCGGVDTGELSSKTMESKTVPGLYYIGEVVDVTGHLGGYNFQWAWASGYVAGLFA